MTGEHEPGDDVDRALRDIEQAEANLAKAREAEEQAERELKEATAELERARQGNQKQYHYTVDGTEYSSDESSLTGAQIRSRIPNLDPAYQLVEESRNDQPDRVVTDSDSINLNVKPELAFYLMPPATFGR